MIASLRIIAEIKTFFISNEVNKFLNKINMFLYAYNHLFLQG